MRIDRPEQYYRVSLERIRQGWFLYNDPNHSNYALSIYVAGLAVECMLRSFKLYRDPVFDERHDLVRLFKASGMLDFDPEVLRRKKRYTDRQIEEHFRQLQAAASLVCDLWLNEYRFASEEGMRAHLKKRKADRGIEGDYLRYHAKRPLEASQTIIDKGVFQWRLLKRSKPS